MQRREKNSETVVLHLNAALKNDLKELAAKQGHEKLSTFVRQIIREVIYGKYNSQRDLMIGTISDD